MAQVTYNYLGGSGVKVSNICLGTMTFGKHPGGRPFATEEESHAMLDRFVALGGNFIDTADLYQVGLSETIVGKWLAKQERHRLVIATKCGKNMDSSDPNATGASRFHIMNSIDKSLERLQTTYADIYYIHTWDEGTPVEETFSALNDLVKAGKVRYVAMSNAKGWQIQKIIELAKQRGWDKIVGVQMQYSMLCRSTEWEVAEVCRREGVALLPWSPLKGGWLSGRVRREGVKESGTRIEWSKGRAHHSHPDFAWFADNEQVWRILDKVEEIAKALGRSVPQVALRWLLQKPEVPSVVIGVRTMEQLEDNMAAASGWNLSREQMQELDSVSLPPSPYPYDYINIDNVNRKRHTPGYDFTMAKDQAIM